MRLELYSRSAQAYQEGSGSAPLPERLRSGPQRLGTVDCIWSPHIRNQMILGFEPIASRGL